VDFERGMLKVTPEKGGRPRIFRMSSKLIQMLSSLDKNKPRILSRYKNVKSMRRTFEKQRKKNHVQTQQPKTVTD